MATLGWFGLFACASTPPVADYSFLEPQQSCRDRLFALAEERNRVELEEQPVPVADPAGVRGFDLPISHVTGTATIGRWLHLGPAELDAWPLGRGDEIPAELTQRWQELPELPSAVAVVADRTLDARDVFAALRVLARPNVRLAMAVRKRTELPELDALDWDLRRKLEIGRIAALGRSTAGLSEPLEWAPLIEMLENCEIDDDEVPPVIRALHKARRPRAVQWLTQEIQAASTGTLLRLRNDTVEVGLEAPLPSGNTSTELSLQDPAEILRAKLLRVQGARKGWLLEVQSGSFEQLVHLLSAIAPDDCFVAPPEGPEVPTPRFYVRSFPELPSAESPLIWRTTLRALLSEMEGCFASPTPEFQVALQILPDGRLRDFGIEGVSANDCVRRRLSGFRVLPSRVSVLKFSVGARVP